MCFQVAQWWRICLPRRRDLGLSPGSGRPPGKGSGNPLQYSCLGNPMGRGAWWATFHGVAKELRHDLATCGSAGKESACKKKKKRICLQCRRPGFDPWVGKIPWRRERIPTPVFWLGEFHGPCSPLDHKELDMTEWLLLHFPSGL